MAHSGLFAVHGEPFIDIYKQGLRSDKEFQSASRAFDLGYAKLLSAAQRQYLFVKDMAYHAAPFISDDHIRSAIHTFLVRDPRYSIPSLFRMRPDYSEDQPGFSGMVTLYDRIAAIQQVQPLVIDADSLIAQPEESMRRYFDYIGVPLPDTNRLLQWPKGSREEWQGRESWHIDAINSQSFVRKYETIDPKLLPEKVIRSIELNLPHYQYMLNHTKSSI